MLHERDSAEQWDARRIVDATSAKIRCHARMEGPGSSRDDELPRAFIVPTGISNKRVQTQPQHMTKQTRHQYPLKSTFSHVPYTGGNPKTAALRLPRNKLSCDCHPIGDVIINKRCDIEQGSFLEELLLE